MTSTAGPDFGEIEDAAARLAPFITRTPMIACRWLSEKTKADVWLKLEMLQLTGSFKLRGALNAVMRMADSSVRNRTLVTASAGNHGVAVAWAARQFGMHARVHVPASAPAAKRDALVRLGAELIEAPDYDAAEARARADAASSGDVYLSPYDHRDVIAGAATIAMEMLADRPDLDALVAPIGGGGLLAGTAIAARLLAHRESRTPPVVIGAEAEASPVFSASLAAGQVVEVRVHPTLADGLAGNMDPHSGTFALVRDHVDRIAVVAEDSIRLAMRGLLEQEHLIVEGASATAIGALLQGGLDLAGKKVGVILTGRNVDRDVVLQVLRT
jgi:threonine dehydratase